MRNIRHIAVVALAAVLLAAGVTSCGIKDEADSRDTERSSESATAILADPETEPSPEDTALIDRAAEILWEEYDLPAREHFEAKVQRHVSNGTANVRFELRIGGYHTYESYQVYFEADGSVKKTVDISRGEYSRFLKNATAERIAAAKAALADQLAEYDRHSGYYLTIDEDGYLCLSAEVIVEITPSLLDKLLSEEGCGVDHEHKFYNERICGARE
jgi:hypothetical protein